MSKAAIKRTEDGHFPKGVSGNPAGRPKGSKNQITLLRQSLELALRHQASHDISEVLGIAIEKAKQGDNQMIKLLLEMHMSKSTSDDAKATEKVAIQINSHGSPAEVKGTTIDSTIEDNTHEQQAEL
jgi:hypothetical protein